MRSLLLCLLACAAAKPEAAEESPRAPMAVEWVAQSQSPLALVARIHRYVEFVAPVNVTVTVPEGLRVVSGRTAFAIPEGTPPGDTDEALVFEIVQPPSKDLVLEADVRGQGFGVHARRAYALVRKPPAAQAPAPASPEKDLQVGERKYGPSVPAKQ